MAAGERGARALGPLVITPPLAGTLVPLVIPPPMARHARLVVPARVAEDGSIARRAAGLVRTRRRWPTAVDG